MRRRKSGEIVEVSAVGYFVAVTQPLMNSYVGVVFCTAFCFFPSVMNIVEMFSVQFVRVSPIQMFLFFKRKL